MILPIPKIKFYIETQTITKKEYIEHDDEAEIKMSRDIDSIIQNSSYNLQSDKTIEELSELIRAVSRYRMFHGFTAPMKEPKEIMILVKEKMECAENLKEEIADVYIMLEQIIRMNNISENEIKKIMREKIDRTLERLGANDNR
jgi:NTP pyrophosphatase (non-canonical NTP hydrolase)